MMRVCDTVLKSFSYKKVAASGTDEAPFRTRLGR